MTKFWGNESTVSGVPNVEIEHRDTFHQPVDPLAETGGSHWGSLSNVASILLHGLLSHKEVHSRGLTHVDLSHSEVQLRRSHLALYRGGPSLHEFANLSWHPRNAALFLVVKTSNPDQLVVTEYSRQVLALPRTRAIPQHAASGVLPYSQAHYGQVGWARQSHQKLIEQNFPEWDLRSWQGSGVDMWGEPTNTNALKKSLLQAEVLVPHRIPSEYITRFWVRSPLVPELLKGQLVIAAEQGWKPRPISMVVCPDLFFQAR
jgi:hypothetical protein